MSYKYTIVRIYQDRASVAYRPSYKTVEDRWHDMGIFIMEAIAFIEFLLTLGYACKVAGGRLEIEYINGTSWQSLTQALTV